MGEHLIKPYEISVWEEKLISDGAEGYTFTENKLAVIGSDTMTGLNKVYDPVFNKKSNGEKSLSFSLKYRYVDPYSGEEVENPFAAYLVNERKVKLHYDGEWYEFIIKDHTESTEESTWTYTCADAFVLELSKQGYNITFDAELQNNQGTAKELAEKVVKDTDWRIGHVDEFRQLIAEPIYEATLVSTTGITIVNTDDAQGAVPSAGSNIYLFYSYVKNKNGKNVQFIIRDQNRQYIIDDKKVITDTNYRITTDLIYDTRTTSGGQSVAGFWLGESGTNLIISYGNPSVEYHANRLAYNQKTTYDDVMGRTVNCYTVDNSDREVYEYKDYVYTTSNVVMNYMTNADDFNVLDNGSLQGWDEYTDYNGETPKKLELVTRPEIGSDKPLADINVLSAVEGFLKVSFNGVRTAGNSQDSIVYNTIYNSGLRDSSAFLELLAKGQQFVFRWRAGVIPEGGSSIEDGLESFPYLGLLVAKYDTTKKENDSHTYKTFKKEDIVLDFRPFDNPVSLGTLNNEISGGVLINNNKDYEIDGVVQTPSTKYIYNVIENNTVVSYIWNGSSGEFERLSNENYLPYYYLTAAVETAVSKAELQDAGADYGIFIYTTDDPGTIDNQTITHKYSSSYCPDNVSETVEAKNGTPITVSYKYIDGDSKTDHELIQFTAGQSYTSQYCQYNPTTKEISITDSAGIYSYEITYSAINPVFIQDIQFTRYLPDGNSNLPITIGNAPVATSVETSYYYLKPDSFATEEDVQVYTSLPDLEEALGLAQNSIRPNYNEGSEKYLTISAAQSNCFNILQDIAETFECWVELEVEHDNSGYVVYEGGLPKKFINLREYIGKDNYAGFKYGINLQSIERQVNSDEFVTKLIVDQSQSDLVDEGYISIANASSNLSGESYILNFDYYYSQGLLNREDVELDKIAFLGQLATINNLLKQAENLRISCENSLTQLGAKRNEYSALISSAEEARNEALEDFETITGMIYDDYVVKHALALAHESITEPDPSYTAVDPDATENIIILSTLPEDDEPITITIGETDITDEFEGHRKHEYVHDPQIIPIAINETRNKDKTYKINLNGKTSPVADIGAVDTITYSGSARTQTQTWNVADLVGTEKWNNFAVGNKFSVSVTGSTKTVGAKTTYKQTDKHTVSFVKGTTNTKEYTYSTLTYNSQNDTIKYTYKPKITYIQSETISSGSGNAGSSSGSTSTITSVGKITGQVTLHVPTLITLQATTEAEVILTSGSYKYKIPFTMGISTKNPTDSDDPDIVDESIATYNYDKDTNVLEITSHIDGLLIKQLNYEDKLLITYDGLKTFKFTERALGNNEVTISYIPDLLGQLTNEDTILDKIGAIYTNTSVINSYSGLLTNVEQEYWRIRKALRGDESFNVKVWTAYDYTHTRHVYIECNDYLDGLSFQLSDGRGSGVTTNQKYFEFESEATQITFTPPNNYSIEGGNTTFTITDDPLYISVVATGIEKGIQDVIDQYIEQKNDLTKKFNNKYSRYIQEGTWSSTEYIDPELYYLDAVQVSNTSAQPTVSYTINVVEISEIEGYEWYLFDAGDKSYVEDPEFFGWEDINIGTEQNPNYVRKPIQEEVIVSEVEWHLDEPDQNTITVQNYKTRFEDLFQRISATVQTVQYNEASYAKTSTLLDTTNTINQSLLLDSLNNISGQKYSITSNDSVVVDGEQILIQNLNNLANRVIINSEGIQVSADGGLTWKTVINGRGINISAAYTGGINTDNIIIGGNSSSTGIRWDQSGISAYKVNSSGEYDLNTYVRYDQYGLYGMKDDTFKAESLDEVIEKAYFAVTWDGFFIRNSYSDGGRVSITSENDFQVIDGDSVERIKIGSLGVDEYGERIYGINISDNSGRSVLSTNNAGDLTMTGTINALGGNFTGIVRVGPQDDDHIIIDGTDASISTSNYHEGAGYGWMINKDGDAVFNNITARGAIKTAVFEYAEIQAVGGIFIFRPSSTIKSARISDNDLILKVEKPLLFAKIVYSLSTDTEINNNKTYYRQDNYGYQPIENPSGNPQLQEYYECNPELHNSWCKISNYIDDGSTPGADVRSILLTNGLSHVYRISNVDPSTKEITLEDGAAFVTAVKQTGETDADVLAQLEGGALVDMGRKDGSTNYGIGVNSSDNTVNLPARAISLFETVIDESRSIKVSYNFRGILGTLPELEYEGNNAQVSSLYHTNMKGTQGIYTDNMYIGDNKHYLAFYTDKNDNNAKKLTIKGADILFTYDDGEGGTTDKTLDERLDELVIEGGEDAALLTIDSSEGNIFRDNHGQTELTVTIFYGSQVIVNSTQLHNVFGAGAYLEWEYKNNTDSWIILLVSDSRISNDGFTVTLRAEDVYNKANFRCKLII